MCRILEFARFRPARGLAAALLAAVLPGPAAATDVEGPRVLSLPRAIELAVSANPGLAAAELRIRAAEGRRSDAGRRPNPLLEASVENWGGALGSDHTETTVGLTQALELGGDRRARVEMATAEVEGARADRELELRELSSRVAEDFIAAWVLQERFSRLRVSRQIAAEAVAAAGERLAAGAASAVERIRAEGNLALTEAELARTAASFSAARRVLALRWNRSDAEFDSLELPRPVLAPPPSLDSIQVSLAGHPDRARVAALTGLTTARVRAARAGRVPDLDARVGVRHLREAGGAGWIAGISISLPVWSTRGGALTEAEAERSRAALAASAIERRLDSELRSALEGLRASVEALRELEERGTPAADQALATIRSGYRAGRLSYLDLVEGQRAALETRLAAVEGAAEVWRARVALERLLGAVAPVFPTEVE